MEQTFRLELKDRYQVNEFLVKRSPHLKRVRLFRRVIVPLLLAIDLYFLHLPIWMYLGIITAIQIGWTFLLGWTLRRTLENSLAADKGVCTMAITPEMLLWQNSTYETRVRWEKFSEVTQSPNHLIFLLPTLGSFIIPKNTFQDEEHAVDFLETARAYQAGTLTTGAAPTGAAWPPPPRRSQE